MPHLGPAPVTIPGRSPVRRPGILLLLLAMVLVACSAGTTAEPPGAASEGPVGALLAAMSQESSFIVHRTDTCSCCGAYEEILEGLGVRLEASVHEDLTHVRAAFGIPDSQASCHTGQIAGYAIEGHVPVEAIERLLRERPEVDGIALAGMPAGSPGMPGPKQTPLVVTLVDAGQVVGELGRF